MNVLERAKVVVEILEDVISPNNRGAVEHRIRKALQKQDELTRNSIANSLDELSLPDSYTDVIYCHIVSHEGGVK